MYYHHRVDRNKSDKMGSEPQQDARCTLDIAKCESGAVKVHLHCGHAGHRKGTAEPSQLDNTQLPGLRHKNHMLPPSQNRIPQNWYEKLAIPLQRQNFKEKPSVMLQFNKFPSNLKKPEFSQYVPTSCLWQQYEDIEVINCAIFTIQNFSSWHLLRCPSCKHQYSKWSSY